MAFSLFLQEKLEMHRRFVRFFALAGTVTIAACGGGGGGTTPATESAPADVVAPAAAKVDEATAGNINGKVVLEGAAPKNEVIKMNADPVCMREAKGTQTQETFVGEGGALGNVFVYVKEGLGDRQFDVPTETVTLDQEGCRYHPHVFGIRVGQPLSIVNNDPTLHNIHAVPKTNKEFNTGQPIEGMKFAHTFTDPEVMVPFKCDVHGWMNAYAGVVNHPYFAVTGNGGTFELKTLPPGNYVVEAWHEKLGTMTQNVTVGEKETKDITFTFKVS
jgi:plastocyanin